MDAVLWFVVALVVVFVINLVPAFMPSTWVVLAFFYIKYDLPLVPLGISGAIVSGFGRLYLAKGSDVLTRTFFKSKEADLRTLGNYLKEKGNVLAIVVFVYSLTPLPTNNLFIAAGMVKADMKKVLAGFWAARIPADIFWMYTGNATYGNFSSVFEHSSSLSSILLQLSSLASIVLLYVLPWGKWLNRYIEQHSDSPAATAGGPATDPGPATLPPTSAEK